MTQRRGVRAQIRALCSLSTPLHTSHIPAVSDGGLWMKLRHCWANLLGTLDVVCCLVLLFLVLCPTSCCNFLQFSFSSFSMMFRVKYEEWPLRVGLELQTMLVDARGGGGPYDVHDLMFLQFTLYFELQPGHNWWLPKATSDYVTRPTVLVTLTKIHFDYATL